MKKILIGVGVIVVVLLIAGGSFWGGMTYQSNRVSQIRANFFNTRGGMPEGGFTQGLQPPSDVQGRGFVGGRGTSGEVKTINGDVMTLSTAQDVITVNLSDLTRIKTMESATIADLQPGTQVMVIGQSDSDGNITADQVTIITGTVPGTAP
jgi:hypothetical protein